MGEGEKKIDSSAAVAAPIASKQSARPALDIVKRLQPLTRQGEDYIWRPAADAIAEIERLRSAARALLAALEAIALKEWRPGIWDTGMAPGLREQARSAIAAAKAAGIKAEG